MEDITKCIEYDYDSAKKLWKEKCNVCEGNNWTLITSRDRYGYSANSYFCNSCGFITINPQLTEEEYAKFYDGIYRPLVSAYHKREINENSIKPEQLEYAKGKAKILDRYLSSDKNKEMLDIGGSTGIVAQHLAEKFNLNATVIDPAPLEISSAAEMGIKTVQGLIEKWNTEKKFILVCLFQTIDHLIDVKGTFNKVNAIIDDNGIFVFDIVDVLAVARRCGNYISATKIDHPSNFNEITVEYLIKISGFTVYHKSIADDGVHVTYICKKNTNFLENIKPNTVEVSKVYSEIRKMLF